MAVTRLNPQLKHEDVSREIIVSSANGSEFVFNPTYCNQSNYVTKQLIKAWPHSNWTNGAIVTAAYSESGWKALRLTTTSTQTYDVTVRFFYLE